VSHIPENGADFTLGPPQLTRRRLLGLTGASVTQLMFERRIPDAFAAPATVKLRIEPITFEVAPRRFLQTVAYNGEIAPVLRLSEGQPVSVQLENRLSTEEYVHWHGFKVGAALDGTPEEDSLPVPAAGRLDYTLPPQRSGSFYVHSHAMTCHDTAAGMYSGQFAFVYVDPRHDAARYDREVFLTTHEWEPYMINEAQEQRSFEEMHHLRLDPEESESVGEGGWDIRYRVGSINGRACGHGEPIRVRTGERVLFRMLNGSATENVELALPGHMFFVLAMDGAAVPHPTEVETLTLGVGERIDALVEMTAPGVWILGSTNEETRTMGMGIVVEYAGAGGEPVWADPTTTADWNYGRFAGTARNDVAMESIELTLSRLTLADDGTERWAMKNAQGRADTIELKRDRCYRVRLRNESDEWHPMHLHRHIMTLTQYRGRPIGSLPKDTFLAPPFEAAEFTVTPRDPGLALFHCHNQMHMDAGLQVMFNVR
jgi:FtsP/CotA-like multicopper oxidase with cupredoxin domain